MGKQNSIVRNVSFKNVIYTGERGDTLGIIPLPYWDNKAYNNTITMGIEKYIINVGGELKVENISETTLKNLDSVLSNNVSLLRRLS